MDFDIDQVNRVLAEVIHPSHQKDIVTLGFVQNLEVDSSRIAFNLSFNKVNDPLKSSIKKACENILRDRFGENVEVDIKIMTNMEVGVKKEQSILSGVKNIIAIASGKGGVGKSTVATNLAIAFGKTGAKVGLIDADIFGPSIPKMLGTENDRPYVQNIDGRDMLVPVEKYGIKSLSIGYFVNPDDATIWRGPMASNALGQLMKDANWGKLDYLFVDLPPGTSDIHLTLVQTVQVTGVVIVSTPQKVALADVTKGINMFMNDNIKVPVLGLVENMAWFTPEELPDNRYYIFGSGGCAALADKTGIPLLGQIPIVQSICEDSDHGQPTVLLKNKVSEAFKNVAENLRIEILKRNTDLDPTKKVEITRKSFADFKK